MVFLEVPTSVWLPTTSTAASLCPSTREPEVTSTVSLVRGLVSYSLVAESAVMVMGRLVTSSVPSFRVMA